MKSRLALLGAVLASVTVAACAPGGGKATPGGPDVMATAAAEATAIVRQAQATAMVLQARTVATALIERAGAAPATPAPPGPTRLPVATSAPARPAQTPGPGSDDETSQLSSAEPATPPGGEAGEEATPAPDESTATVELLGVGFAADGGFIMVQFRAPPRVATNWWQGSISVTDEATGLVYNEIPVMPIIGPLIGRPVEAGQLGYAMLVNLPTPLKTGAVVTVVLGDYKFEHQTVQG